MSINNNIFYKTYYIIFLSVAIFVNLYPSSQGNLDLPLPYTSDSLLDRSQRCVFDDHQYNALRIDLLNQGDKIATPEQIQNFVAVSVKASQRGVPFSIYGEEIDKSDKITITCRTLIECTHDKKAAAMIAAQQETLKNWLSLLYDEKVIVFDPFCGSGNSLLSYVNYISKEMGISCEGIGWDNNPVIVDCTKKSLKNVLPKSYQPTIECHPFESLTKGYDTSLLAWPHILIVSPPWGDAVDSDGNLDLGKTHPPIMTIINQWKQLAIGTPTLYVIQVTRKIVQRSLDELDQIEGIALLDKSSKSMIYTDIAKLQDSKKL